MRLRSLIGYVGIALPTLACTAYAQTHEDSQAMQEEIHIFDLTYLDAYGVVGVIGTLHLPVRSVAIGPRRLLVQGMKKDIQSIAKDLIPRIDVPGDGRSLTTEFFPLGSRRTNDLPALLQTVSPDPTSSFAVDYANRMLVARASKSDLTAIRELLTVLQRPTQSLILQFFFIRGKIGSDKSSTRTLLPDTLRPVEKTLRSIGLGDLALLAPVMVVCDEGEHFKAQANLLQEKGPGDGNDGLTFSVTGHARVQSDEIVRMTVQAVADGSFCGDSPFEIDTTIALRFGSYVVLGASPSATAKGNAVALVVRATQGIDASD